MTEQAHRWHLAAAIGDAFSGLAGVAVSGIRKLGRRRPRRFGTVWPYFPEKMMTLPGRAGLMMGFAIFCFLYGAAFALFAPFLVVPLIGLLVPLAFLVIWTIPEIANPPVRLLEVLFFAYFPVALIWPGYLAIALPGLPWITPGRMVEVPLTLTLLICAFGSRDVRTTIASVLAAVPWIRNLFCVFLVLQVISIGFSSEPGASLGNFINAQTRWTVIFFAACFLFAKEKRAERMAVMLCVIAVITGLIGLWEVRLGQVPWAGHIPSFLKVENPSVAAAFAGTDRGDVRRAQSTFGVAQGFGEFLAIVFPFLLHFVMGRYRLTIRTIASLLVPFFVIAVILSQARIGYVGYFITVVAYPLLWGLFQWRRKSKNLFVSAIVYLSPMLAATAGFLLFAVDGIRMRIFGGGALQASTQARYDQIDMGIPKVISHPWGYGIGRGADVLGYYSPSGFLTIDSYWLRLALEYGVVGLLVYFALFAAGIGYAARGAFFSSGPEREKGLFISIGIVLLIYLAMKATFAQEDSQFIIFAYFGMLSALTYRCSKAADPIRDREKKLALRPVHGPKVLAPVS